MVEYIIVIFLKLKDSRIDTLDGILKARVIQIKRSSMFIFRDAVLADGTSDQMTLLFPRSTGKVLSQFISFLN